MKKRARRTTDAHLKFVKAEKVAVRGHISGHWGNRVICMRFLSSRRPRETPLELVNPCISSVCVCVCVCKRERERGRGRGR